MCNSALKVWSYYHRSTQNFLWPVFKSCKDQSRNDQSNQWSRSFTTPQSSRNGEHLWSYILLLSHLLEKTCLFSTKQFPDRFQFFHIGKKCANLPLVFNFWLPACRSGPRNSFVIVGKNKQIFKKKSSFDMFVESHQITLYFWL